VGVTDTIDVVAAVIRRGGRVFLGQRPGHKRHGGHWEFPGGKVHSGESLEDAVARELREELSLAVVSVGEVLAKLEDPGSPFRIHFVAVEAAGEPRPVEHTTVGWYTPTELLGLPLAPADRGFAATLLADR
jgi:8-oxo-dGTP diphosphatase